MGAVAGAGADVNFQDAAHPYQRDAVQFLINHPSALLNLPMGFGKTPTTAAGTHVLKREGLLTRGLVVAPKAVALHVWAQEIALWDDIDLSVSIAVGKPAQRAAAVDADTDLVTINPDNLSWLFGKTPVQIRRNVERLGFDLLILDESALMKNARSKRVRTLTYITEHGFNYRWALTGKPMPNNRIAELWPQYRLIDGGQALGRTFTVFRKATHNPPASWEYEWTEKPGARQKVLNAIAPLTLSYSLDDVDIKMPEVDEVVHYLELPDHARKMYSDAIKEFLIELGDEEITVANAAVLTGKLQQICSGFLYREHGGWNEVHDVKHEALNQILMKAPCKTLVPYWYVATAERIRLPALNVDRWNADQLSSMAIHPLSAGHGLNLQKGHAQVCWFDPTWSADADAQTNARVVRQGHGGDRVTVHRLIMRGTIEERMLATVKGRQEGESAMMAAIRELRR